jgi:hypothetical protein
MVTQADLDAGVIAGIQKDAKSKNGPTQPMTGGKLPAEPMAPETELKADPTAMGAGAPDLAGKPDTSKGLGSMDKLNMIAKMYGNGTGLA